MIQNKDFNYSLHFITFQSNFIIVFDEIKCSIDNIDYIEKSYCYIDKTGEFMNADIQMKKEVQEMRFDFAIYVIKADKSVLTAFKADGVNYCTLKQDSIIVAPLFKVLFDSLEKSGKLPKGCPIPADYHYRYYNMSVNTDLLPANIRKLGFKTSLVYYNRKTRFLSISTMGKVNPTKIKNKGRKSS
ncbi:uncharacterized protein LOC129919328 [Episyrphus balteatus]|uniref:uncharacterized protein LOC129919328 n=1 Tax=Episyrphus balteatus TaxID=286459 RepID=UPI00248642B4|nr:uncharacterized protein LOC129919328 [Episyrphus balteatus]